MSDRLSLVPTASAEPPPPIEIRPAPPSDRPPRETTPPGGVPSHPVAAIDLWRDRARTVLDRFIYFAALVAIVYLRLHDKLDVGTGGLVLLVCGVRPHNVGDVLAARAGGLGNTARAGAVVGAVGVGALSWRSFFATCLAAILAGLLIGGCAHRPPGNPGAVMAKVVLSTTRDVRDGLCDRGLLGPVPVLDVDNPPQDLAGVVGQVRAWLCADALGGLLDLATELLTPRPSPASDGGSSPPSTPPPEDSGGSAPDASVLPSTPAVSP